MSSPALMPVSIEGLTFRYPNGKEVLSELTLKVSEGSFLGVVGENGAGKTTLLRLMMGFMKPSSGRITIRNSEPHGDDWVTRSEIAYLSVQGWLPLHWRINEFLDFHRRFQKTYSLEEEQKLLARFRLGGKERIGQLSLGLRTRVMIVAALATFPRLILVDEITAVLDPEFRMELLSLLDERRRSGSSIVLATNITEGLADFLSHLCILKNGRAQVSKGIESFLANRDKNRLFEYIAEAMRAA